MSHSLSLRAPHTPLDLGSFVSVNPPHGTARWRHEAQSWFGLVGPAKLPQPIVDKLYKAVVKISAQPEVVKSLENLGAEPVANTPAEFAKQIADEVAKNRRIAKEAHIKVE